MPAGGALGGGLRNRATHAPYPSARRTSRVLGVARRAWLCSPMMKRPPLPLFAAAVASIGIGGCEPSQQTNLAPPTQPATIRVQDAPADPVRESIAEALQNPDAFARIRTLATLLPTLGAEHVAAVKQTLSDTSLDLGPSDLELLVRFWASHEPEAAARWALEDSPQGYRLAAVVPAFTVWAELDPHAAASAAEQPAAQEPDVRDAVLIALVHGWYRADPVGLAQYIHDLDMGFPRQRALSTFIRATIQAHGIDAATHWAESLPDDDATYKMAAFRQVASVVPLFDQEAGLRWCDAHCEGPYGNNLRSILARRWARRDGAAALEWLSHAPANHDNRVAVRATFALWGQTDRSAAVAWMANQTAGGMPAWLVPALPVYARLLAEDSPAKAIEWAEQIEGDEEREIVLVDVARSWRQIDEAAAEAWLLGSPLSEEARDKARAPRI